MKNFFIAILLSLTLVASLVACGNTNSQASAELQSSASEPSSMPEPTFESEEVSLESAEAVSNPESSSSTLVVYFSMPETTDPNNMTEEEDNSVVVIDGEVLGNTQYVAYVIAENMGADIFRIEPETPYPIDHDTLVDLAAKEKSESTRPAILNHIENLEQYDTIFIGYPNWWGDMPMILYSFFDEYDLSGKMLIPFNTHGGSGFSSTIHTIAQLEPGANVYQDGFTVSRNNVEDSEQDILNWLTAFNAREINDLSETEISNEAVQVAIQIGDDTLYAELYDTALARDFAGLLPQTLSMQRVGGGENFTER